MKNYMSLIMISFLVLVSGISSATDANNTADLSTPSTNPAPIPNGTNSIGTLFGANNQGGDTGGVYFEIENVSADAISIDSWDVNVNDPQTTVNVWTRPGTYSGFEQSSAGWTLLGNDNTVVSQPVDQPTPVAVGGLVIQPDETYGIAMEGDGGWSYTNGDGMNQTYNNGTLELRLGSANNVAFSGSVFYSTCMEWRGLL